MQVWLEPDLCWGSLSWKGFIIEDKYKFRSNIWRLRSLIIENMNTFSHVPPGFRFHPTDEELVDYYLRKKVVSKRVDLDVIRDVDLYKIEPWDLQELCKIGTEEQNEWYFFSHKDKKYPTGTRTNRATKAGFWKATGRDKAIYSKHSLVGMRKTLVFYQGRAPNGQKSDWIMHEYRLETNENGTPQEEGWVVCRVFKKRLATIRREGDHEALCWYDDQVSLMPDFDSPRRTSQLYTSYHDHYLCKQELELQHSVVPQDPFLQLPQLESPKIAQSTASASCSSMNPYNYERKNTNTLQSSAIPQEDHIQMQQSNKIIINSLYSNNNEQAGDQVTDWRVLDKFVASQLSQEGSAKETTYNVNTPSLQVAENVNMLIRDSNYKRQESASDYSSITAPTSTQIDMWK